MFGKLRKKQSEAEGFTLVELLIVIVILGILAAVVVFAVGGIGDKGQTSACKADRSAIETAEEAYFAEPTAGNGVYGTEAQLVPKFLHNESELHNITVGTPAGSYTVVGLGKCVAVATTVAP